MLQALAILFFTVILLGAFATIVAMLRADWDAFTRALGVGQSGIASGSMPPRYSLRPMRRSIVVRFEGAEARRRAAA